MEYQKNLKDNKTQCLICPRQCILGNEQRGFCFVRKNIDGKIILETYGLNTGLSIDPIEKKPLYNFYPGSKVLSFGTFGCNMGCLFCQNYHISKFKGDISVSKKASPNDIVKIAKEYNCKSVAFTYNDPVIFFEYAIDTAKLCRNENIKTIAVTAGYMNDSSRIEFYKYMDAANIDLKGFSENFYKKNCFAHLSPVLDTIKYVINETNCHIELTTLLIEGENDDEQMIENECNWILSNLGNNIPLHFSGFYPRYKFNDRKSTSFETLLKAYNIAKSAGLKYVYTGNLETVETVSTYCSNCNNIIIKRDGYNILEYNLLDDKCKFCGAECYGRFW